MKKSFLIILLILFQCIGVKNKNNTANLGILALLTGGTFSSKASPSQNGNPTSGTGNGTSSSASADIKSATGGTLNLGSELNLTVSAESIESDTTFTVKKVAAVTTDSTLLPIQTGYEFGPENLNFSEPATLRVCYNPDYLKSKNLSEKAVQIYYLDPDTKEMASVGGSVDLVAHCVTAQVEHFSTYIPAVTTTTALTISAATVTPARPIVGMPLKVKTKITPTATSPLASAFISYRIKGSGAAFTKIPLLQDTTDATALSFYTILPASVVTLAGIEYFIEATDEANTAKRLPIKGVSLRLITRTLNPTNPLRYNVTKPILISSGAYRNLALQVQDTSGLWQTTFSEANDLQGNMGTLSYIGNTIRFTAGQVGVGTITSTYGGYSTSLGITVKAGKLAKVEILDTPGAIITAPVNIIIGQTFGFKAIGYDSFGNSIAVNPVYTVTGGIGTYNKTTGIFTASTTPNISGTLTAKVGTTIIDSVDINIIPNSYPISGVVTGIPAGKSLIIQNNGTDDLTLASDGSFTFATNVFTGSSYNVTILSQMPGVNCTLASGSGTVATAAVTNVSVSCVKDLELVVSFPNIIGSFFNFNNSLYIAQEFNGDSFNLFYNYLANSPVIYIDDNMKYASAKLNTISVEDDGVYLERSGDYTNNYIREIKKFDGVSFSHIFFREADSNGETIRILKFNNSLYTLEKTYCLDESTNISYSCNKIFRITNNTISEIYSVNHSNYSVSSNTSLMTLNNELYFFSRNEAGDKIKVFKILPSDQLIEINSALSNVPLYANNNYGNQVEFKTYENKVWILFSTDPALMPNHSPNYDQKLQLWSFDGTNWIQVLNSESSMNFYHSVTGNRSIWMIRNNELHILHTNRISDYQFGNSIYKYSNNNWIKVFDLGETSYTPISTQYFEMIPFQGKIYFKTNRINDSFGIYRY